MYDEKIPTCMSHQPCHTGIVCSSESESDDDSENEDDDS
jgi:hypothetical protein